MGNFAQRLRNAMQSAGLKAVDLHERTGISKASISEYLSGNYEPKQKNVYRLAEALHVAPSYLMGLSEPASSAPPTPQKSIEASPAQKVTHYTYRIPVVGRIVAGQPILAQEEIIDYEYIDKHLHKSSEQYFGLVVKGASMEPTIHDGDTIIVRVQESVESGQIAVVLVDGEDATVKEVKESEEGLTLIGHNVAVYTPHFYNREEVERLPVRIIGRVIQSISKF